MLVGMGTVFVFLATLVLGMAMMSAIVMRFAVKVATATTADSADEEEIAAITAAIAQHRKSTAK